MEHNDEEDNGWQTDEELVIQYASEASFYQEKSSALKAEARELELVFAS